MAENVFFIGVDVGSGSVRAALVDEKGHVVNVATKKIQTWNSKVDFYEQSSNNIWACCISVIKVCKPLIKHLYDKNWQYNFINFKNIITIRFYKRLCRYLRRRFQHVVITLNFKKNCRRVLIKNKINLKKIV